jgi:hypothetical protein
LDDVGYVSVPPEFFKESYLKDIGMIENKVNAKCSYLIFKKENEKEFKDCLFVNQEEIIHMIFIDDFMVYGKVYDSKMLSNGQQYMSIIKLLSEFDNQLAMYKEMDRKALTRIGFHINKIINISYDKGFFMINPHEKLKDTYHLMQDGKMQVTNIKIIGEHLYQMLETGIKPLEFNFNGSGIDFEESYTFWLTYIDDESLQKESVMEVNFNDKTFFYLKAKEYDQDNPKTNMIVFKNLVDADMSKFSFSRIMHDNAKFQKILMLEASDMLTKIDVYTLLKSHFIENESIQKWWLSEMCKECVSLKTREELGFALEGPLTGNELLVVEAMFI